MPFWLEFTHIGGDVTEPPAGMVAAHGVDDPVTSHGSPPATEEAPPVLDQALAVPGVKFAPGARKYWRWSPQRAKYAVVAGLPHATEVAVPELTVPELANRVPDVMPLAEIELADAGPGPAANHNPGTATKAARLPRRARTVFLPMRCLSAHLLWWVPVNSNTTGNGPRLAVAFFVACALLR
jgi:hypothetical protein